MNRLLLRFFDFSFALIGLIVGFPLLLILYLFGLLDTGRPLFRQERVGRNQKPFILWKFRTMKTNTGNMASHLVDPAAVTPFGKLLRKTKLDEVPQLWNVLKGEMSLVGPRPCLFSQKDLITERENQNVFDVRPGVTGLAQIQNVDMSRPKELAKLDAQMIRHFHLVDYFRFIFLTLFGRGRGDAVNIGPERIYLSPPHLTGEEEDYVRDALQSNWIGPVGPHVRRFEKEIANLTQVEKAVAVSSGTAALHLILRALGIGPGDLVLCSSFTFVASVNPILYLGAQPVLIDSEKISWNLDPDLLEKAIEDLKSKGQRPKALILVHLYGQSANLDRIVTICEREKILLIEDAAEALGSTYGNRCPGSFGVAGFLSFNGNKIITTSGGGMILTNDSDLATKTRYLAAQAKDPGISYEHSVLGYNYSFSNILAAIGRAQLKALPERVAEKRQVFARYQEGLGDLPGVDFMPEAPWGKSTRWLSCVLLDETLGAPKPSRVIASLEKANIESRPLWKPMHRQIVYQNTPFYGNGIADELYAKGLCLPSPSNLSEGQQNQIIEIIRGLFD